MKPVFREGKVHVLEERCKTCIFRPGNLMHLESGRVKGMVDACITDKDGAGNIPCHATLGGDQAICRGFWDGYRDKVPLLQMAERMDLVETVPAPSSIL